IAMWRSLRATLDGRFGDAEVFAAEMLQRAPDEINFHNTFAAQLFLLRRDQGRLAEIKDVLREAVQTAPRLVGFRAALALTDAERHFEVAVALEEAAGSAPLLARTQFSYARALAARGRRLDRTRALDLLDAVAVAADELDLGGLQLGLGALRDRLR